MKTKFFNVFLVVACACSMLIGAGSQAGDKELVTKQIIDNSGSPEASSCPTEGYSYHGICYTSFEGLKDKLIAGYNNRFNPNSSVEVIKETANTNENLYKAIIVTGNNITDTIGNDIEILNYLANMIESPIDGLFGMKFIELPDGTFKLEEGREVTIENPFQIGVTEVTQKQFKEIVSAYNSKHWWNTALEFPEELDKDENKRFLGDDKPIVYISWDEANTLTIAF